jgi:hypothetical protein
MYKWKNLFLMAVVTFLMTSTHAFQLLPTVVPLHVHSSSSTQSSSQRKHSSSQITKETVHPIIISAATPTAAAAAASNLLLIAPPSIANAFDTLDDVEVAELPPVYVPILFAIGIMIGVGVLTSSLGDVYTEEASLGLMSGAKAKKERERSRSSYFKKSD